MVETEDASRGPLSGCIRLADSSRIIQRLKVSERQGLARAVGAPCPRPLVPECKRELLLPHGPGRVKRN